MTKTLVSAQLAAQRTGLARTGESILAWFPEAVDACGLVDLESFLTPVADPIPLPAVTLA